VDPRFYFNAIRRKPFPQFVRHCALIVAASGIPQSVASSSIRQGHVILIIHGGFFCGAQLAYRFPSFGFAAIAVLDRSVGACASFQCKLRSYQVAGSEGQSHGDAKLNPHVWVYIDVKKANSETEHWALEGGGPRALTRGGWKKGTAEVGADIDVKCHIAKDRSNNCLLDFLTTRGGDPKEFD
jgi:hypothetical protein